MNFPLINYDVFYSPSTKKDQKQGINQLSSIGVHSPTSKPLIPSKYNQMKESADKLFLVSEPSKPFYQYPFISNERLKSPDLIKISVNSNLDCFKVYVRIRPLNAKELSGLNKKPNSLFKIVQKVDEMSLKLIPLEYQMSFANLREEKIFNFDYLFDENDTNEMIFKKTVLSPVENLLNGYNSTILAYGMTGTGKTHTMFGNIYENKSSFEPGLILLTVRDIFWKMEIQINENPSLEFQIKFSYLEIYNEQVRDLLVENSDNLMILEDQNKGVVIPDLREIQLNSANDVIGYIDEGNNRRTMASTSSNQFSSRSHAILMISLEKRNIKDITNNQIVFARFSLVDLAGSERAILSENKGLRLTEGANINKSLLALGNCINILSDASKKGAFVPYRDSKLTRLLKESLGGNTKTIMIACLSPAGLNYEETLNTLKYANRAKNIKRKINKNVREIDDVNEYKEIIEALKGEIDALKIQLVEKNSGRIIDIPKEINTKNISNTIEGISQRILNNLEENWEIKQSLNELRNLKISNEKIMEERKKKGENFNELHILSDTMKGNELILEQMERSLGKIKSEREKLYKEMTLIHQNSDGKLVIDLQAACAMLNKEKMDLHNQNLEMRKKEENLTKLQKEKDTTIIEMQKQIEVMKKKLSEKDKIIEENNILIKNLSSSQLEAKKVKNYRSNTSENSKNLVKIKYEKIGFKPDKTDEFAKNSSTIRQYFKGKSTDNSKLVQKINKFGIENKEGILLDDPLMSNRSNNNNEKNIKKNLEKLSECSSLTRFEAGNADYIGKTNSNFNDDGPIKLKDDIEFTKKIVDNLSEVSSIHQEDNHSFSISDDILADLKQRASKTKKNEEMQKILNNLENENKIKNQEKISIDNFTKTNQRKIPNPFLPIEKNNEINILNIPFNQIILEDEKKVKPSSFTQSTFNQSEEFSDFKNKVYFLYEKINSKIEIDNKIEFMNEIAETFFIFNEKKYNIDEYYKYLMQNIKEYFYKNNPNEKDKSLLEKNRSMSANNRNDKNEKNDKNKKIENFGSPQNKLSTGFIRTSTEKGFYDTIEKNKKKTPFHYVKYSSIYLQEMGLDKKNGKESSFSKKAEENKINNVKFKENEREESLRDENIKIEKNGNKSEKIFSSTGGFKFLNFMK